jgi:cysteine desulfurase
MVNFNSNKCSLLSEEVTACMKKWLAVYTNRKADSFGADQTIRAEIEQSRYQLAELLKAGSEFVFFTEESVNLINSLLLTRNIHQVIIHPHDDVHKLAFLKNLEYAGSIELIILETADSEKFNTKQIKSLVKNSENPVLLSLQHADPYTGTLIPVKEIAGICKSSGSLFHLDTSLTIDKYPINFMKLRPDFMSFSSKLINGPVGTGVLLVSKELTLNEIKFKQLHTSLRLTESQNLFMIKGFEKALNIAIAKMEENKQIIYGLKDYLVSGLNEFTASGSLQQENLNHGLYNLVRILVDKENTENYIREKLDMAGISIDNPELYPVADPGKIIIPVAFNRQNTHGEIDHFIDTLHGIIKSIPY